MVKFAHLSDCHLGSWSSHPEMKEMPLKAFEKAINTCIVEGVDFIVIAGDLLDTSLPGIDVLRSAAALFRQCKEAGIPVYIIAGSHDYSPTGKTMLSVFEEAGLIRDISKYEETETTVNLSYTTDEKTGVKLFGIFGKKGSLEVDLFSKINREVEQIEGKKIFVFHAGIDKNSIHGSTNVPVSLLPNGFDYYATGHIHIKKIYDIDGKKIGFPGPLFPTSFDELENYDSSFYIINMDENIEEIPIKMFSIALVERSAEGKTPSEVESALRDDIENINFDNTLLLLKVHGTLKSGKPSDVDFKGIASRAQSLGALTVKKNISKLVSREMESVRVENTANLQELEKKIISEYASQSSLANAEKLTELLMNIFKDEKGEDETNTTFEEKIKSNAKKILELGP